MYKGVKQKKKPFRNIPVAPRVHPQISKKLEENIAYLQKLMGEKSDMVIRHIHAQGFPSIAIVYIESLINKELLDQFVIQDIQFRLEQIGSFEHLSLSTNQLTKTSSMNLVIEHLLSGDSILFFNNHEQAYAAGTEGGERRSITEPSVETVVRGPREAFNESIQTNLGLIRRKLRTYKLRVEKIQIGTLTNTPIAICYLDGIAQEGIVQEVRERLDKIKIDGILESLYIEEMIEDPNGYTPFPTIYNTERPDKIVAGLLEGRVAIAIDGTPVCLLVPATLNLFMYSNEDYYQRYDIATVLKLLRTATFIISLFAPGFYVALLTFHQEMLPTPLLIALTGQREGVPFGIALELLVMEVTFEILREAGIRLPKTIGAAVSIVGGLVLGQTAVQASLVTPGTVITVALTGIASFCTPSYNLAIAARLLRFVFIFLAAFLGSFGLAFGIIFIFIHLNSLHSFGIPYLSPMMPVQFGGWKDLFIRAPWWMMKSRPEEIVADDAQRLQPLDKWSIHEGAPDDQDDP
jgi:spore germination protein KA